MLGKSPVEMLRRRSPLFKKLGLEGKTLEDAEAIALMVEYPELIQRPIIVCGERAVVGSNPEEIEKLL